MSPADDLSRRPSLKPAMVPVLLLLMCMSFIQQTSAVVGQEKPSFRIIAPEFICNPASARAMAENTTEPPVPRQLTIGFQTTGGQRLQYRVSTYFSLPDGFVSQRHTVGLWRAVRALEQRIRRDRDQIADSGQLTIASDELLPGVSYTFSVVGVDATTGSVSDEQNFTMNYRSPQQGASFESASGSTAASGDVSLLLLGSETTYADLEYSLTAQLLFCRTRIDYFFRWDIVGTDIGVLERSRTLRVPARSFTPGRTYDVRVQVFVSASEQVLASAHMPLTVLERQPTPLLLVPSEAIVGIDQPTEIRAFGSVGSSPEDVLWSCRREGDTSVCDDTMEIEGERASVTFFREGQYHIAAMVNETEGGESARLTVHRQVTPSVRLLQWFQYPAVSGAPFRALVSVAGLVPKCHATWTVLREEGFAYFDPAEVPGESSEQAKEEGRVASSLGGFFVRDIEENFLSELVDYGNDTIVRECALVIPGGAGNSSSSSWQGLQADVRYKFRLQTTCPEPFDDSQAGGRTPEQDRRRRRPIESHWTFVLETNGAPRALGPLEVSPAGGNGTALETIYRMVAGIAQDVEHDYPLRYSYWYVAEGVAINVGSYYEITSAETVLPYTGTGAIETYAVVCDAREACAKIDGPEVRLQPGRDPSAEGLSFALATIEAFFDRLNLREALKSAFELLLTLRNRNSPLYADTYRRFGDIFRKAIGHIDKVYRETAYLSEAAIQQFVMQAKPLLDLEESSNHELFEQLLALMDLGSDAQRPKRSQDAPSPAFSTVGKINARLYLMEGMTASSNASVALQARTSLLDYVHQAAKEYCASEPHHVYVGQLITLEVNRHRSLAELNLQRITIPNKVVLSAGGRRRRPSPPFQDAFPETEYYCVGRVYYARDLFGQPLASGRELDLGFYEAFVLSVDKGGMWTLVGWKSDYFLWSLDGRQLPNVTCQLWADGMWSRRHCVTTETPTDEVLCNCTRISYLRLSNETEAEISPSTTTSDNGSTASEASTVESSSEPLLESSTHSTLQDVSARAHEFSTTEATSTGAPTSGSTVQQVEPCATESDMITLPPVPQTQTAAEAFSSEQPPSLTEHGASPLQAGNGGGSEATAESDRVPLRNRSSMPASSVAYAILAALAISTLLMAILTVAYRRRRIVLRLADELHTVPSRTRTHSPHVRYARFQDEHNMAGDNVSTISEVLAI